MKNTKYYGLIVATLLMAAGCKRVHHPVDKIVYTTVSGWHKTNGVQDAVILNLENEQELLLHKRAAFSDRIDKSLPEYEVGDTVWVLYDERAKHYGEMFSSNVMETTEQQRQYLREQQRGIYGKKR